jgi:hypothetical protein
MVEKRKAEAQTRRTSGRAWADQQERVYEPTSIKLPEGKTFLQLRSGIMRLDVIPYYVGRGNPCADEGFLHFERTYWCYKIPMPNGKNQRYVSLRDTFGKPDPIFDWVKKNGGTADRQLLDGLRPQQRHLFNVIDVSDETEKKKGIQVLDTTFGSVKYPSFGKMLKDKLQMSKKFDDFHDPERGLTIVIKVEEDKYPGGKYNRVTALEFDERDRQYDFDIVEDAVCLDNCLVEYSYDELKRIFLQEPLAIDNGQSSENGVGHREEIRSTHSAKIPSGSVGATRRSEVEDKKESAGPTAEDLDLEVGQKVKYDGKEYMIMAISGDGTSLTLAGIDDDSRSRGVAPADVQKVSSSKKTREDPEEDDGDGWREDNDLWEDEPEEKEEEDLPVKKKKRG